MHNIYVHSGLYFSQMIGFCFKLSELIIFAYIVVANGKL